MPIYLKPFDPARDFKALKFFRYEGQIISRNDPFPLDGIPERKAKQLYETRFIGYADEDQIRQYPPKPPAGPAPPEAPIVAEPTEDREALIKRLANRYKHETLFKKAKGLAGVEKKQTKAELVAALLDAGRASADGLA